MNQLNPKFFNSRNQFTYQADFLNFMKMVFNKKEKEWSISYEDISHIFIIGDNIEGKYSATTPLIINLFFERVMVDDSYLQKILQLLEIEMKKNVKYANFKLKLKSDIDPRQIPRYFDIFQNQVIVNKDYPKKIEAEPKKVYVVSQSQEEELKTYIPKSRETQSPKYETLIAVPHSFSEALHIIKGEAKKIITYSQDTFDYLGDLILDKLPNFFTLNRDSADFKYSALPEGYEIEETTHLVINPKLFKTLQRYGKVTRINSLHHGYIVEPFSNQFSSQLLKLIDKKIWKSQGYSAEIIEKDITPSKIEIINKISIEGFYESYFDGELNGLIDPITQKSKI